MSSFLEFYRQHSELFYNAQLILAMFGMGATSTVEQFRAVFRRPTDIGLVLGMQFLVMPTVAVAFAWATRLAPEVAVGLVLMMALPSGTLSNIITFLGRGNVPLSVTATCASTAICLLATPLVLQLFAAQQLPSDFQMPLDQTVLSIVTLLMLPLLLGMVVGSRWPGSRGLLSKLAVWGSMIAVAGVWVGALGGGQIKVFEYGWATPVWLVVFIIVSLVGTNWLTQAIRYQKSDAFTLAVEVSMRNGNLGVALCLPLFGPLPDANHKGALYTCLFAGGAMMVIGLIAVGRRLWRFSRQRRAGREQV